MVSTGSEKGRGQNLDSSIGGRLPVLVMAADGTTIARTGGERNCNSSLPVVPGNFYRFCQASLIIKHRSASGEVLKLSARIKIR